MFKVELERSRIGKWVELDIVLATELGLGFSKDKMKRNNTSKWVPNLALMKNRVERNNLSFALQLASLPSEGKECELICPQGHNEV